ncbi:MAG: TerC family protein [Acidobacteriota bacterium]
MEVFTLENLVTLGFLVLLQAVLGFDNLLYISLESKRAPKEMQAKVRRWGILIAIGLRIVLLFVILRVIDLVQDPFFSLHAGWIDGEFNLHSVIVLLGGAFILYTAMKEIWHMVGLEMHEHTADTSPKSAAQVITVIVIMNLVFSFDSILSAIALTQVFVVMATAIVTGGVLMIWLADTVSEFLQRNRMYEVLGLFILFVVGIMLVSEGGHLAHLHLFGNEVTAMSKTTFYFVISILVLTEIVQSRYKRRLAKEAARQAAAQSVAESAAS